MEDTIFDKILGGEIPANKVYEDNDVLAFRDVNPQAPVHVLVIPKKRAVTLNDLEERDPAEVGAFFQKTAHVADELGLCGDGYRVVINNGKNGQQSVAYLHAHILGGRQLNWPPG